MVWPYYNDYTLLENNVSSLPTVWLKFWNWRQLTSGIRYWRVINLQILALVDCLPQLYSRAGVLDILIFWEVLAGRLSLVLTWLRRSNQRSLHPELTWWRGRPVRWRHLRNMSPPMHQVSSCKSTALSRNVCALWCICSLFLQKLCGNSTNSLYQRSGRALRSWTQIVPCWKKTKSFPAPKRNSLKSSPISKVSVLITLSPFSGPDELLRATGRTKELEVAIFEVKHLILLGDHHLSLRLCLQKLHNKHCHQSVWYQRALIRQNFAIVKLRNTWWSIQSDCVSFR